MAHSIKDIQTNITDIKVVRGDTFIYPFAIHNELELRYIPNPSDTITLYIYNKFTDNTPLLTKKIPYDDTFIRFSAKETQNMRFGNYVYCIKIKYSNGHVDTVLSGNFSIVIPGGD